MRKTYSSSYEIIVIAIYLQMYLLYICIATASYYFSQFYVLSNKINSNKLKKLFTSLIYKLTNNIVITIVIIFTFIIIAIHRYHYHVFYYYALS